MPTTDIDKAKDYLRGIAAGDPDLVTRHVEPDAYVEHNPRVADGALGLFKHVASLPKGGNDLQLIRVLREGAFVVTQTQGDLLGSSVSFDVFEFEAALIVEHWLFCAAGAPPNKSGHTQTDGQAEPRHPEDTQKNKSLVRDYYETVHLGGQHDQARRWFAGDLMIRHEPGVADGVNAFLHDLEILTRDRSIDEISLLVGQGDLVFLAAKGTHLGKPCAYVDLYRVENEKIVEHWGFPEPFPPRGQSKNDNGLL